MKTIGIFCGSFDPFHIGHKNILDKSLDIFGIGNVIVAIGINLEKDIKTNIVSDLNTKLGGIVESYTCFTPEYIEQKEKEGFNVVLIRGIRDEKDFIYETKVLKYMKDFKPDLKYIFIQCDEKYNHISSSDIRNMEKFRKGSAEKYIY